MTSRDRDSQRKRVYRAEHRVWEPAGEITVEDAQKWCESIRRSEWMKKHYPGGALGTVHVIRGRACHAGRSIITLSPTWGTRKFIVLHELAHVVHSRLQLWSADGSAVKQPPHGREWAMIYRALVRRFYGVEREKQLVTAWKSVGVTFKAKRTLSPETLERLRSQGSRLAAVMRERRGERND